MQIHVVRPGETLYGIARQYGVSVTLLGRLNQVPAGVRWRWDERWWSTSRSGCMWCGPAEDAGGHRPP